MYIIAHNSRHNTAQTVMIISPLNLETSNHLSHLLNCLVKNEDNTGRCTNNPDGLPPHSD